MNPYDLAFIKDPLAVSGEQTSLLPPKIFAHPFRLALKKGKDVTWLEVRSLKGLRNVFDKLESGELEEVSRFASVEMQLWGLMAEHSGFMRIAGNGSTLAAGIQPLGEEPAALADDLASIMGGTDVDALKVLGDMRNTLKKKPIDRTPMEQEELTHEFVKPDGVNLTQEGEEALISLVYGPTGISKPDDHKTKRSPEGLAFQKDSENAIQIFKNTPAPTAEESIAETAANAECVHHGDKPLSEICKLNAVPPTEPPKVGAGVAHVGRLVEQITMEGKELEDALVRDQALAAQEILDLMIEVEKKGIKTVQMQSLSILERFNVSMEELKDLAQAADVASREKARKALPANSLAEARQNINANARKLMETLTELKLAALVEQSPLAPEETEPVKDYDVHERMEEIRSETSLNAFKDAVERVAKAEPPKRPLNFVEEPDQTYGSDHYKSREVKPAHDTPMWRSRVGQDHDPAEDWREHRKSNDSEEDDA